VGLSQLDAQEVISSGNSTKYSPGYYIDTIILSLLRFLPCDATRCTVFGIVILSVRPSVRLSVCHTRALCPHGSTYDHDFFTIW